MGLLEKVQQLTQGDDWANANKNLLFEIYQQVFFKPVNTGCDACLHDAFYELKSFARQMKEGPLQLRKLRKYEVVKHVSGYLSGFGKFSTEMISDDTIAYIEKYHPQIFADHFQRKAKKLSKPEVNNG